MSVYKVINLISSQSLLIITNYTEHRIEDQFFLSNWEIKSSFANAALQFEYIYVRPHKIVRNSSSQNCY